MLDTPDRAALLALLDFYVEAGVDLALEETPRNRFADAAEEEAAPLERQPISPLPASQRPPLAAPVRRMEAKAPSIFPEDAAQTAREQAKTSQSLADLEALLAAFEGCGL